MSARLRNRPNTPAMVRLAGDEHDGRIVTVCRLVHGAFWTTEPELVSAVAPGVLGHFAWHDDALIPLVPPSRPLEVLVGELAPEPVVEGVPA